MADRTLEATTMPATKHIGAQGRSRLDAAKDRALQRASDAKRRADHHHRRGDRDRRDSRIRESTRFLRALDRLERIAPHPGGTA